MLLLLPGLALAAVMSADVPLDTERSASAAPWQRYAGWPQGQWGRFSNLARGRPSLARGFQPLEQPIVGDPETGRRLVVDRNRGGGCVACHILSASDMPGNVGPNLSTIGAAGRSDEYLFNYVFDARTFNPHSVMPPWGAHGIFSPEEILDIVAFLKTEMEPATLQTPQDDPGRRALPRQEIDNLDEFENPGMRAVEQGTELYSRVCASCHAEAAVYDDWAPRMPKYEPRLGKMLGIEEFLTRHARATTQSDFLMGSEANVALAVYLRYLANGRRMRVDVSDPGSQAALELGRELAGRKLGELNFACTDCHQIAARRWIRGSYLPGMDGMPDHFPMYRTGRGEIWDIRKRMQWCNVSVRADELPPDAPEYGAIELYLAVRTNGQKLSVPGIGN